MIKLAIEEFLNKIKELEEDLKTKMTKEKSLTDDEHLLLQNDIIPLRFGNTTSQKLVSKQVKPQDSSFLGMGEYSAVYDCVYKGQHCAAKITRSNQDLQAIIKLAKLKEKLGPLGKHILNIKKIIYLDRKYIILVEYLKPTNIHLKNLFEEGWDRTTPSTVNQLQQRLKTLLQPKILSKIIKDLVVGQTFNEEHGKIKFDLVLLDKVSNIILEFIEKNYLEVFQNSKTEQDLTINYQDFEFNLSVKVKNFIMDYNKNYNKNFHESFINRLTNLIMLKLKKNIFNVLKGNFPNSTTEFYSKSIMFMPEVRSLIKCLIKLKEFGISFSDLHYNNIMERNDGTLVISDPGLFYFDN